MSSGHYGIILVYSTSHALKAERVLRQAGISCKLIPVPRHISSDCGSCVRVDQAQLEHAYQILKTSGVGVEGHHEI